MMHPLALLLNARKKKTKSGNVLVALAIDVNSRKSTQPDEAFLY